MDPSSAISVFKWASIRIGCHEAALKLLFSLLVGYPLCVLYNVLLVKAPPQLKHIYFISCGFSIGLFNYGFNILHTLVNITAVYLLLTLVGGTRTTVSCTFVFCTTYLLWGYYKTQSDEYAFAWTIPQCVLTLKLIAVAFDFYDGSRKTAHEKKDLDGDISCSLQNEEALLAKPSFLELLAHCYFPASFLVGPQFGLHRYLKFAADDRSILALSVKPAMKCLGLGVVYLVGYQAGSLILPLSNLTSERFIEMAFWKKIGLVAVVTKIQLCKYICIWLISEGSCIISGVTYDAKSGSFETCSNVRVYEYETTYTFGGLIRSFNVSTNHWAAKYIFKRLKFMNSKFISHLCTLVFLAVWHGWKSGYYITFTMEFLIMKQEWEITSLVNAVRQKNKNLDQFLSQPFVSWTFRLLLRIYVLVVFGYCLLPFVLLTMSKWLPALKQVYFFGHLIYVPWLALGPILIPFLRSILLK